MATATVTFKLSPGELYTVDEALRLYAYIGHQPPLVVLGKPFEHYTWNATLDVIRQRAQQAEEIREQIGL